MHPLRHAARVALFFSLLLWTWLGPFGNQVLHRHWSWAQHWVMFSGASLDLCAVRYTEKHPDGTESPVDRWQVLGLDRWSVPPSGRVIGTAAGATRQGQQLCRDLPSGTDLRVYARCATRTGWARQLKGETNVCSR